MRRRRWAREGKEKRKSENRRPILQMLCAALLRSFRRQHSEKIKWSAQGNWDPREGQQPFRPNPNGAGDRTTTLRRQLIGAVPHSFAIHIARFRSSSVSSTCMVLYFFSILPYLFSTKKQNVSLYFWTGRPHSLGSCHFRGVWAICLSPKGGVIP